MTNNHENVKSVSWTLAGRCPSCGFRFKATDTQFDEEKLQCPSCGIGLERSIGSGSKRFFSAATYACLFTFILLAAAGYYLNYAHVFLIFISLCVSIAMLVVVFPDFMLFVKREKWKATTRGRMCAGCGYDLYGVTGNACPECGKEIASALD
jgi:uncharacterized paraquat-inducible protein A